MNTYDIDYLVDNTHCRGYMVEPKSQGCKLPGIIMYTDFWGVNERQKRVAEKLANIGAVVVVADMYGNQQCGSSFEDSGRLMQSVIASDEVYQSRIFAPYELLKKNSMVNQDRLFSIGYCFGGASSLLLARLGEGLCGAVSVHGLLGSKTRVSRDKKIPKILILQGARDPLVPEADIKSFKDEMLACNADYTFISYGLATHAFSNADAAGNETTAYHFIADKRTDHYIKQFLNESF